MAGGEDHGLQQKRRGYPPFTTAETGAQQGGSGQRDGTKEGLLPNAGLGCVGQWREPWPVMGQQVRIHQRLRRRPPAELSEGKIIENHHVEQHDCRQQVTQEGAAEHGGRRRGPVGPQPPELGVVRIGAARQTFRGEERQEKQQAKDQVAGQENHEPLRDEPAGRERVVVFEPFQRPGIEGGGQLYPGHHGREDQRLAPEHRALPQ